MRIVISLTDALHCPVCKILVCCRILEQQATTSSVARALTTYSWMKHENNISGDRHTRMCSASCCYSYTSAYSCVYVLGHVLSESESKLLCANTYEPNFIRQKVRHTLKSDEQYYMEDRVPFDTS
eukprot:6187672-Pleurochrysis_carterae.AAC.1